MTDNVLVQCPYCNINWIKDGEDLVCSDCVIAVELDMTIADLLNAIEKLKTFPRLELKKRHQLLSKALIDLNNHLPWSSK